MGGRTEGWRDEEVMEGWWEYREGRERGTTVGREEEEHDVIFCFYSHPWVSERRQIPADYSLVLSNIKGKKVALVLGADFFLFFIISKEGLGIALDTRFENERTRKTDCY